MEDNWACNFIAESSAGVREMMEMWVLFQAAGVDVLLNVR